MKVLCISYYDKFSRFFIGIEKELKKTTPSTQFEILSLYPSGYFYSLFRGVTSTLASFKCWLSAYKNRRKYASILSQKKPVYREFDLDRLIDYQIKLNKNIKRESLLLQAIEYINFIDKKTTTSPDVILLIGDSRLLIDITKIIAKRKGIKTYFIEQGPYNTTFFDTKGVNANASIAGYQPEITENLSFKKEKINQFINRVKDKKYNRLPFYRGFDYILEFLIQHTVLLPPDLKNPATKTYKKAHLLKELKLVEKEKNVFLLICQVPFDVNLTHHSPFYSSHTQILKDVYTHLPEDSVLIVREHPLYKKKYAKEFYEFISTQPGIYIDTNKSFDEVLEKTHAVIVNNSTVGLEAIIKGKPVLALGNSYYDRSGMCLKLQHKIELKELLKEVLHFSAEENKIDNYLYELFTNHLIEGHIIDENLNAAKQIAHQLNTLTLSK